MKGLVNVLSNYTERTVEGIIGYDLQLGGYIDYTYYDSCDKLRYATYYIENRISLAVLEEFKLIGSDLIYLPFTNSDTLYKFYNHETENFIFEGERDSAEFLLESFMEVKLFQYDLDKNVLSVWGIEHYF